MDNFIGALLIALVVGTIAGFSGWVGQQSASRKAYCSGWCASSGASGYIDHRTCWCDRDAGIREQAYEEQR